MARLQGMGVALPFRMATRSMAAFNGIENGRTEDPMMTKCQMGWLLGGFFFLGLLPASMVSNYVA